MPSSFYKDSKLKIYLENHKIRKGYCGDKLFYTCGNTVTYVVNGANYYEDVEEGASVLSPTSFTPAKPGWTFHGWSLSAAGHSVQTNLTMGENPIALYAVWRRENNVPDQPLVWTYDGAAEKLTPYNPGGDWTAEVSIDEVTDIFNNTAGNVLCNIRVGGTVGRSFVSKPIYGSSAYEVLDYRIEEYTGYPGYGGASFQISGSGNITADCNKWEPYPSDGTTYYKHYTGGDIHISNVVKKGTSTVEWSVG